MDKKLVKAWDQRAEIFKTKKEAVMQQSFPKIINNYIHRLHLNEVLKVLPERNVKCLDIGCGYGRIASEVIGNRKNAFVYGVDISKVFVNLFNAKLKKRGRAFVGSLVSLPFEDNKFDCVICIVTMMYLEKDTDQRKAISEMLRVVKRGGRVILIEPNKTGDNIIKLFGLLPFFLRKILRRKKVETFGITFPWGRIDELVKGAGGTIIEKKGYPFFTLSLLPILALSKISTSLSLVFLRMISVLDNIFSFARTSYVATYVIKKA